MQKSVKMMQENNIKKVKIMESCQVLVKNSNKLYENCDCYLEYQIIVENNYFMFEYLKIGRKSGYL